MRRVFALLLLLSVWFTPAPSRGQSGAKVYLPLVAQNYYSGCPDFSEFVGMSDWKIIVQEDTINNVLNPSGEIAANFAAEGAAVVTRVTTASHYGVYSYRVQTAGNNEGIQFTLDALANAIHYVTLRVSGTLPAAWDWSLDNVAYTAPALIADLDGTWSLYGLQFSAAQSNGSTRLRVHQNGAGAGDFNIDGVQVEEKTDWTTYCDGEQTGCEWLGAEHASQSQRSAVSRAGGSLDDLGDDYHFDIGGYIGIGMAPLDLAIDQYAILPGGQLNSIKVLSSTFTLTGVIRASVPQSTTGLHANRQDLLDVLKSDAVPETEAGAQPIILRYEGAAVDKEISAHYMAGLEANIVADMPCWEQDFAVRFAAPDPFWREVGESAQVLDTNDTVILRYVTGRLRSTGQWDDLGLTNNPTVNGTIRVILVASDGLVYVGGDFQGMNNVAGRDYIARYDPVTDTWATLGAGGSVNSVVRAIAEAPNGDIYIGGNFTNVGGAAGDYVAYWDVSGGAWSPVAAGGTGAVYALTFGQNGTLYIGGTFINWNAIANADYIVSWNGAAYAALSTGANGNVYALTTGPDGTIYVGGAFVTIGGVTVYRIATWDGSAFAAMGNGFNSDVNRIVTNERGLVYAVGIFTTDGGAGANTFNRIAEWNSTAWSQLDNGANAGVSDAALGPDGVLYVSGLFTAIGSAPLTTAERVAKWTGSSWAHLDVNLPGTPEVAAVAVGPADPVILVNYDIWLGFSTTGAGYFSGTATATNDGTRKAYPLFVVSRIGGTTATLEQLRNETTGKELLFDYDLLDGETLTVDLRPTRKSIVSNFFGPRPDAILPNSDFGEWALLPGANQVTCFVDVTGAPTIFAYLLWEDTYWSVD